MWSFLIILFLILLETDCRWILEQWGGGASGGVLRLLRVLHRDQTGPHDLAQAAHHQHGEKTTHTENEIKCRLCFRKDLFSSHSSNNLMEKLREQRESRLCLVWTHLPAVSRSKFWFPCLAMSHHLLAPAQFHSLQQRVYRVPECLSLRRNRVPPLPHRKRVLLPPLGPRRETKRGWGGPNFQHWF